MNADESTFSGGAFICIRLLESVSASAETTERGICYFLFIAAFSALRLFT